MSPYDWYLLLACFGGAFLIGSIPVAYLVVHLTHRLDLTRRGSGNVGAMNAFEVTGSRWVGVSIGIGDALKGVIAVAVGMWMLGVESPSPAPLPLAALAGVVAGHNYNPWLSLQSGRLEGGKGLAAAGGGLLVYEPLLVPVWAGLYAAGILIYGLWVGTRRIIAGNVVALTLLPLPAYLLYGTEGLLVALVLALITLPKHRAQVRDLLERDFSADEPPPVAEESDNRETP